MMKRPLLAATAVAAALVVSAGCLATSVFAAPKRGPKINRVTVTPKRLPSQGGMVDITVRVKEANAQNITVSARASLKGVSGSGPASTLTRSSAGLYTGQVAIPANSKRKKTVANIFVGLESDGGNVRPTKKASVTVAAGGPQDDSTPPPPPPI
ncbi:MAG: hypothetical protein ACK47B_00580 [Armatimonadota bacterium]